MEIWKEPKGTDMVCHIKCMGPDSVALFHVHDNYEFCQPVNCSCDFLVDGQLLRAAPGDIICVESLLLSCCSLCQSSHSSQKEPVFERYF